MKYLGTLFGLLALSTAIMALPTPQAINADANERANDGEKAVENELKIQESVELTQAGCAGAVVEGAECEAIDAKFAKKLADAKAAAGIVDDAAAADAGAADAAAADDKAAADKAAADKAAADKAAAAKDNKNQGKNQGKNN